MESFSLLLGSLLGLVLAALYLEVGRRQASRATSAGRGAQRLFALFWLGVGVYGLADAAWALALAYDASSLAFAKTVLQVKVISGLVGFFGLVAYVGYIYTGRGSLVRPIAVGYAVLYVVLVAWYAWRDPIGQSGEGWGASLLYARDAPSVWTGITLALFLPPLAATGAFAFLLRHITDRRQRLRGLIVSLSLATFLTGVGMSWLSGAWPWWGLFEKTLALLLVSGVLVAMRLAERAEAPERAPPRPGPAAPVTPFAAER